MRVLIYRFLVTFFSRASACFRHHDLDYFDLDWGHFGDGVCDVIHPRLSRFLTNGKATNWNNDNAVLEMLGPTVVMI